MSLPTNRREFLRGMTAAGASLPLLFQSARTSASTDGPSAQVENEFMALAFDVDTGRLRVWRKDGGTLIEGASVRVNLGQGQRSITERAYRHDVEGSRLSDRLGDGRRLTVRCTDSDRQLDVEIRVDLYTGRPAVLIEAECQNVSARSITVKRVEPLYAPAEAGGLLWSGVLKVLTNGPMYYDAGKVTELAPAGSSGLRSWWNVGFFRGYDKEGLVCGYVENQTSLGQIQLTPGGAGAVGLTAESILAEGFELQPRQTIRSGRFMIQLAPDPYAALEAYAEAMGRILGARAHSVVNGWCDWFTAFEHITEEEVLRNAEYAARVLKPFGLETIQVDEGFQRWHGDWEGNARFPHGMKALADRIRELGLKPGLWLAPYVISEPAEVFGKHPEWLIRHLDGRLKRVGPWPSEDSDWARNENPKRYGLDITHPGAAAWLADLSETVVRRWGYEMLKIDFVDWSLLSAQRYFDPTVTRAQAYRRGFEIIRRAIGPDCHLQDCGPGPVTVGLLDSMRIELDQNYGFRKEAWKQYFTESTSSAPAAAKRYYFHKRTWINDADHVCLNLLSPSQAQAAASLIALTGGNLISGDRLPDLDPVRLEILKKIVPSYGEAARPVDLFDSDRQSVFALRIRRPFGEWTVAGFFNANLSETLEREIPLERLWLDPAKTYLAYDFWGEHLLGEVSGRLRLTVGPGSVMLLAIHERRGVPQVLSTDRHVLQGAIELENVAWDPATKTMEGVSVAPVGTAHNVAVYVPEAHPWVQGGPFLYHDLPSCTAKMMDDHMLRIRVRFTETARVQWKVELERLFGKV